MSRQEIHCCVCKEPGYGGHRVWYKQCLVLSVHPNDRSCPKIWVCRKCIRKHSKLTDDEFVEMARKAAKART